MGTIGKKLSSILSKSPGSASPMYDFKTAPSGAPAAPPLSAAPQQIPINSIVANTVQPRHIFDEAKLQELSASIKEKGVLQPVIFRSTESGRELIAGERRWRAAKLAGLQTIPAIEMKATDEEALELAIIENIQRDDLNPIEKGLGFKMLIEQYKLTQQQVAERVGIDRTSVTNFMRLLQLPQEVKDHVSRGTLSMGHARCLLAVTSPLKQASLAKRIAEQGLSVRQTEELIYGNNDKKDIETKKKDIDPHVSDLEKKFAAGLGAKVTIKNRVRKNSGKIIISYSDNEDFCRLAEIMGVKL